MNAKALITKEMIMEHKRWIQPLFAAGMGVVISLFIMGFMPEGVWAKEVVFTSSEADQETDPGQEVVDFACQYVGNPYVWAGTSLEYGADCSGFVLSVYANFGVELPHLASAQAGYGDSVSVEELQPGDLIFYGYGEISHVAIYKGDGEIVHAQNEENGICISPYDQEPIICCRRLL